MSEEEKQEEEEIEFDFYNPTEYIQGAYFALNAVDEIDTAIMNKSDEQRVKRIRRKSLRIIDECLNDMYDELFETDEEE